MVTAGGEDQRRPGRKHNQQANELSNRKSWQGSCMRRRLRIEEAAPKHGESGLDRRHHVPDPRGPIDHRDGSRTAAQRTRAPTS